MFWWSINTLFSCVLRICLLSEGITRESFFIWCRDSIPRPVRLLVRLSVLYGFLCPCQLSLFSAIGITGEAGLLVWQEAHIIYYLYSIFLGVCNQQYTVGGPYFLFRGQYFWTKWNLFSVNIFLCVFLYEWLFLIKLWLIQFYNLIH